MSVGFIAFATVLVISMFIAILHGGREERLAAAAIFVAAIVTPFMQSNGYEGPELGIVFVDVCLFLSLAAIAFFSSRFWPIWAAGFQLAGVSVHLAVYVAPHILPVIYADTLAIWSYPVLFALLVGCWSRYQSEDRDWL